MARPGPEAELWDDCTERGPWKPCEWRGHGEDCVKGEKERRSYFAFSSCLCHSHGHGHGHGQLAIAGTTPPSQVGRYPDQKLMFWPCLV